MARGKMKWFITVEKRKDVARNQYNDLTDWEKDVEVWAQRIDKGSKKIIEGGQFVLMNEVTWKIDKIDSLDIATHRIVSDGNVFEIMGIIPDKGMLLIDTIYKGKWQSR